MNDLISRKALLKEIEAQYDLNYGDIMTNPIDFYEMVDCQETIHVDNKWIPVSERLPDKAGAYLVANNMRKVRELNIDDYHDDMEIMYFSLKHKKFRTNSIVIAWQPLPEPWKGEEE